MRCRLLCLLCLGTALQGCGTEVSTRAQAIVGGAPSAEAAVMQLGRFNGARRTSGCTAFVVAEHVAVTAAHCFDAAQPSEVYKLFAGGDASSLVVAPLDQWIDVTAWELASEYTPAASGAGADIAVLATDAALPATPLPLPRDVLLPAIVGEPVRMIGYGETVPGDTTSAYRRYEVTVPVSTLYPSFVVTNALDGFCFGDSGGPELLTIDGQEVAVAVMNLRNEGADGGSCTGTSLAVRIDRWMDSLITPFIAAHATMPASADLGTGSPPVEDRGCAYLPGAPAASPVLAALFCAWAALRRRSFSRGARSRRSPAA